MNYKILVIVMLGIIFARGNDMDTSNQITLQFTGDLMGHDTQIAAAYDAKTKTYNYDSVFIHLQPIFKKADYTIANLEVTLAGPPYKGYPAFSSPDEFAIAAKESGIDAMILANNHCMDRGKKGLLRTLDVIDSLEIPRTGTFRNQDERDSLNLMVFEKGNISVGVLNYTYGTNGIATVEPTIVNRIKWEQMKKDVLASKSKNLDKLIVAIHWGKEYQLLPSNSQKKLASFLFDLGVDIIIGSHPHVIQPMEYRAATDTTKEELIVYSLGNFVSNQRKRYTDGGAIFELTLTKDESGTYVSDKGYYLTWVHKPKVDGRDRFEIVPCTAVEKGAFPSMTESAKAKMSIFTKDSRQHLGKENVAIDEIVD